MDGDVHREKEDEGKVDGLWWKLRFGGFGGEACADRGSMPRPEGLTKSRRSGVDSAALGRLRG